MTVFDWLLLHRGACYGGMMHDRRSRCQVRQRNLSPCFLPVLPPITAHSTERRREAEGMDRGSRQTKTKASAVKDRLPHERKERAAEALGGKEACRVKALSSNTHLL